MHILIWAIEVFALACIAAALIVFAFKDVKGRQHYCLAGRTTVWLRDGNCPICGRY
jgi:hypothetical protein